MSVATYTAPFPRLGPTMRFPTPFDRPAKGAEAAAAVGGTGRERVLGEEAHLLIAARQGDASAFEALVRRHQGPLYNFCLRLLGRPEDAGDVVQDAFIQLYNHLDRLDERDPVSPWLFRVARNRSIDLIRRRRTVPFSDVEEGAEGSALDPADDEPLPEELAERADVQRLLTDAIAALPPAYAEVVSLRYAGDRSFAEIAAILGCDEVAARVRFHRAKGLLRRYLHGRQLEE